MLQADERRLSSTRMVSRWFIWFLPKVEKTQDVLLANVCIRLEHGKTPRGATARGLLFLLSLKEYM